MGGAQRRSAASPKGQDSATTFPAGAQNRAGTPPREYVPQSKKHRLPVNLAGSARGDYPAPPRRSKQEQTPAASYNPIASLKWQTKGSLGSDTPLRSPAIRYSYSQQIPLTPSGRRGPGEGARLTPPPPPWLWVRQPASDPLPPGTTSASAAAAAARAQAHGTGVTLLPPPPAVSFSQ